MWFYFKLLSSLSHILVRVAVEGGATEHEVAHVWHDGHDGHEEQEGQTCSTFWKTLDIKLYIGPIWVIDENIKYELHLALCTDYV